MSRHGYDLTLRIVRTCFFSIIFLINCDHSETFAQTSATAATEITETFSAGDFDRTRWALANTTVAITKADFSKGVMRMIIPPGPDMRPLLGLNSRFGLEGDFEIRVDYAIHSLPRPEKEWANLSIFIQGPDGMAAMTRTHNMATGHGFSRWFQPPADSKAKVEAGGEPTVDRSGTLRLVRVGKELQYSAAARGQPFHSIGTVAIGDRPIDTVGFQVLAPPMKAPIDLEYDNISVKADRLTGLTYVPESGYGPLPWILGGALVVALALLWWWSAKRKS
jgi:hypothetical protein